MHRARTLVVALVVGCLLPALASAAETERFHKVVPLGPGGTLKLNNFSGDIRITGSDGNQVTIDAIRRGEREQLDNIKLVVETSGDTVSIDANRRNSSWEHHDKNVVETEFEIQVPRQAVLDIAANFDRVFPGSVNTKSNTPHTLAVIRDANEGVRSGGK